MFYIFNRKNKQDLLLNGSKTMSYGKTIKQNKMTFKGYFYNIYAINEEIYRREKLKAFDKSTQEIELKPETQRNQIIWAIHKELKLNPYKIKNLFDEYKIDLSRSQIQKIIFKFRKEEEELENDKTE